MAISLWLIFEKENEPGTKKGIETVPKYIWFTQYSGGILFYWLTMDFVDKGITLEFDRIGVLENVKWIDELLIAFLVAVCILLFERRVFCKYVCPVGMLLRFTSRIPFPMKYQIKKQDNECVSCGVCNKGCLMEIRPTDEILEKGTVSNPDCINCVMCVSKCPKGSLRLARKEM